jgi:hypothetical protein
VHVEVYRCGVDGAASSGNAIISQSEVASLKFLRVDMTKGTVAFNIFVTAALEKKFVDKSPKISYESLEAKPETDGNTDDEASPSRGRKQIRSLHQSVAEGLWPSYCNPDYVMPDTIDVKVVLPTGDYVFPVKIVKQQEQKLYFGGYRSKVTGSIYHHASSQTPTDSRKDIRDTTGLRTRETQTVAIRSAGHQTVCEAGTQMDREDVRINKKRDVVRFARRYITADQVIAEKMVKAVVLQRYWRGFMARRRANGIRERNVERDRIIQEAKEKEINRQNLQREENMRRRLQPKTNADFEILYNELDAWRRAELVKIKVSHHIVISAQ